jgi:hypothetical protein
MTLLRRAFAVFLLTLVTFPPSAFGWLSNGHMAVAYVAYQHLTPAVRNKVNALVKKNPNYKKWLAKIPAGTSAADRSVMLFMLAATWPDEIKANGSGYKIDPGSTDGDRPGPDLKVAAQNIGYSDKLYHKYWHFVDTPFTDDGTTLPAIPTPDAETQIELFRTALASGESQPIKSYDLVWLLHLVGDVHQPLHCSTRVSAAHPDGDRGGNAEFVCTSAGKCTTKLHAFWDGLPGTNSKVNSAMTYAKALTPADSTLANELDTDKWIKECFDEANKDVYAGPITAGDGPFTITAAYRTAASNKAREQIELAGERLAKVIDATLK